MVKDDFEEYRSQMLAKLEPGRLRATLTFVGLYQLTHEMIKRVVIDNVKAFYLRGADQSGLIYDEDAYKTKVLDLDPKSRVRASVLWLVSMNAITPEQADRLKEITDHRNDLIHELAKYLIGPKFEPDVTLFVDALGILRAIHDFWIQVEIDTGILDDHPDVTPAGVAPASLLLLDACVAAYVDGIRPEQAPALAATET
jgi:hypothetical protein